MRRASDMPLPTCSIRRQHAAPHLHIACRTTLRPENMLRCYTHAHGEAELKTKLRSSHPMSGI